MTISRTHLALVALLAAVILLWAAGAGPERHGARRDFRPAPGRHEPLAPIPGPADTRPRGDPVNGNTYLTFRLFDTGTGGVPLWFEIKSVSVINGLFTTKLGDECGLDPHLFNGQPLWLEVAVEGDPSALPPARRSCRWPTPCRCAPAP